MPQRLDAKTKAILTSYLGDVRSLPNESAKTHRFAALVAELFPGTRASTHFAAGVERIIRVDTAKGKSSRLRTGAGDAAS